MSDRLEEFQRQRGLVRNHLAWLEREIAALEGTTAPDPSAPPPPIPPDEPYADVAPPLHFQARAPVSDLDAEAILAEYRKPPVSIQKQAKFGCLLYFVAALAIMALFVAAVYIFVKRAHGR